MSKGFESKFRLGNTRAGKLTGVEVLEMRRLYNEGWSQGRLARHFGISIGQVGRIVRNEAWQELAQLDEPPRGRWEAPDSPNLAEAAKASQERLMKMLADAPLEQNAEAASNPTPTAEENPFAEQEALADERMKELLGLKAVED